MGSITTAIFVAAQAILYFGIIVPCIMILAEPDIYCLAYIVIEGFVLFFAWRGLRYAIRRIPYNRRKYWLRAMLLLSVFILWQLLYVGLERENSRWTSDDGRATVRWFDTLNGDMFFPAAIGSGSQTGSGYVRVYCEGRNIFELYDYLWGMADEPNRTAINDAVRQCTPQTYIK